MAAILIDARVQFGLARMKANAQRAVEVDIDLLEAELRTAMSTGQGFEPQNFDMDGRIIE
jgi:hypothetical protein